MNDVVFYVRAKFSDDKKIHQYSNVEAIKNFSLYESFYEERLGMCPFEYRTKLHEIQLKLLNTFPNSTVIINERPKEILKSSFYFVHPKTVEQLAELREEAIVIPIDDDDWISPHLPIQDLNINGITIWNAAGLKFCKSAEELSLKPCKVHSQDCATNYSSCAAISSNVIKHLIKNKDYVSLKKLMQRHSQQRNIVNNLPLLKQINTSETTLNGWYGIYLRNVFQVSFLKQLSLNIEESKQQIIDNLELYKKITHYQIKLEPAFKWAEPYIQMYKELHKNIL